MADVIIVDPSGPYRNDLAVALLNAGHRVAESFQDLSALERAVNYGFNPRSAQLAIVNSPKADYWWKIVSMLLDGNPNMSVIDHSGQKHYGLTDLCVPQAETAKKSIDAVCRMVSDIFQPTTVQ